MYSLNFQGGDKSQQLRMTFDGGAVTQISRVPKKRPNPHVIPITKEQLEGVLDPMTAAFLYRALREPQWRHESLRPDHSGVRRRGALQPHPQAEAHGEAAKELVDGYSGFAAVCRVKFIPISGYRPDNPGIKLMSETNEIEVWLVSLPGHRDVRALSHCVADARGLWLCDLDFLPNSARRQARKPRLERSSKPARQGVNGEAPNPNM